MDVTNANSAPATSAMWAHVAASYPAEDSQTDETSRDSTAAQRRIDDGASLRARLLRMIVDNDQSRKRGAEAPKPR
jgi:hypothetical protein